MTAVVPGDVFEVHQLNDCKGRKATEMRV
jgi:hypothetical protein